MLEIQMRGEKNSCSGPQALHCMNVSATLEKLRKNFKVVVVLQVSVSLKEASGEKLRISLFVKNRSRGAF